jgi:hypothetical protein
MILRYFDRTLQLSESAWSLSSSARGLPPSAWSRAAEISSRPALATPTRWLPPQRSLALCLAAIGDHFVATRKVFGTSNVAGARDRPSLRRQLHRHHSVRRSHESE